MEVTDVSHGQVIQHTAMGLGVNSVTNFKIRPLLICCFWGFFLRASGRKMEKFSVSVNIAANSSVTFTLTYEELLQRRLGKYELMIRVKPKQLVRHFEVEC